MPEIAATILPIFALIGLGYAVGRTGLIGEETSKGLASFTFVLAIPALMFRAIATTDLPDVSPALVWLSYFGSALSIWLTATLLTPTVLRRPASDSASIAMSSAFGNVVMVGIPICLSAFGPNAAGPIALVIAVHSPLLWLLASMHLGLVGSGGQKNLAKTTIGVLRELSRNPMILAIIAGSIWRLTGFGIDSTIDKTLVLLGGAAVPCALVSLGLSLIGLRIAGQVPTLATILILKLIAMPLIAWIVAVEILNLPAVVAGVIVIFAAMPTGANAYLFARQHGHAVNSASASVALGTAISIMTATATLIALESRN